MSVRAYHLRRKAYRQTANPVSNPGQPSPVNRKARRVKKQPEWRRGPKCQKCGHWLLATDVHHCPPVGCAPILDPDPPLKCWCGNCLPGQDRECPAKQALDPRD